MSQRVSERRVPRGLMRTVARAPIGLFHLRLGWLFGGRFLMLTHIGRRTGLPRHVVLEVVRHDPAEDEYIVASGWSERADWLMNIHKNPHVLLDDGRRRLEGRAARVPPDDAPEEFAHYARQHPQAVRMLARTLLGQPFDGSIQHCRALARSVPLVSIRPYRPRG